MFTDPHLQRACASGSWMLVMQMLFSDLQVLWSFYLRSTSPCPRRDVPRCFAGFAGGVSQTRAFWYEHVFVCSSFPCAHVLQGYVSTGDEGIHCRQFRGFSMSGIKQQSRALDPHSCAEGGLMFRCNLQDCQDAKRQRILFQDLCVWGKMEKVGGKEGVRWGKAGGAKTRPASIMTGSLEEKGWWREDKRLMES